LYNGTASIFNVLTIPQENPSMKNWLKWFLRILLLLVGLALSLVLVAAGAYSLSNRTNGTIVSSGEKRAYLLYVPESYDPSNPTPLVISIHGYLDWPAHQMKMSHWNTLAEEYGFIAVYPSGTGFPKHWRISTAAGSDSNPEVVFIADLIEKLAGEYNIDPDRIYANGLSNGGGMSFLLACSLSEQIAAVGMVSGAYLLPWSECQGQPVPAVIFHGTADPIVPYLGGPSRSFDLPFPVIPTWVETLARHNGCSEEAIDLPPSGAASGIRYGNCTAQADVVFYTITGGGHSWPGGEPLPEFIAGETNQDIDATRLMWEFFQEHPLQRK
jgi:polyhydroxybutyrate depolymerase